MKLLLEATVADRSGVLGDGLVRVHVTGADGRTAGRLSLTVELWEWVKLWLGEATGWEIEIRERGHDPGKVAAPATMRGRLLAAAREGADKHSESPGDASAGGKRAPDSQGEPISQPKGRVGTLWKQVQERKRGK